jgi:hypothetical protein
MLSCFFYSPLSPLQLPQAITGSRGSEWLAYVSLDEARPPCSLDFCSLIGIYYNI